MTRARDLANQADLTFDSLELESTDTSVNIGPIITLDRNSASPANWNKTGAIVFSGRNDASETVEYFQINSQIEDYADGTENGRLQFMSMRQGTLQETMFMNSWGDLYFQGYNPKLGWIDHKGTTNDLFVGVNDMTANRAINFPDADGTLVVSGTGANNFGIGTSNPTHDIEIKKTAPEIMLEETSTGGSKRLSIGVTSAGLPFINAEQSGGVIAMNMTGSEVARFNTNGLSFPSGYGIDFSATGDSSGMSSELLDDYEEGTWTPTITGYNGGSTQTYSTQNGNYIKVGRLVVANFYVALSNKGNIAGNYSGIGGLPYATETSVGGTGVINRYSNLASAVSGVQLEMGGGINNWGWLTRTNGTQGTADGYMNTSQLQNNTWFMGTLIYRQQ